MRNERQVKIECGLSSAATQPGPAAVEAPRPAPESGPVDGFGVHGASIMIVDDEPVVSEVVRLYLEDAGYQDFRMLSDSTRAVDLIGERAPDVVLLDLMMPQVSGFDILERLRADPATRHLPVIVLTSASDPGAKLRALELGANDILAKPVDASELVLRLRNTLAAKAYQDRLAYQDPVTRCPNARMLAVRLDRLLSRAETGQRQVALFRIGLDRFKQVNTAFGTGAGDLVLRTFVSRIRQDVMPRAHEGDEAVQDDGLMLARLGGDEFVLLVPYRDVMETVPQVAEQILALVARPLEHAAGQLFLTAAIGIAIAPDDGNDPETLLSRAGAALAQAKRSGGNGWKFSSEAFHSRSRERLALEGELRGALAGDALVVHYQPKIELATGRITGAEALMRWSSPSRGLVYPDAFIGLAEETGLIVDFGAWILHEACRDAQALDRGGSGGLGVAVNVSARQFEDEGFPRLVENALAKSGLAHGRLTLELTESLLMSDPREAERTLRALKDLGVRLALDDFGTGYSSLAYLKRFPLDELKIDRSFIKDIPHDVQDAAIVEAVLALARSLGLSVTAEGIETEEQRDFLISRRCQTYQGFLHSRPVDLEAFGKLL